MAENTARMEILGPAGNSRRSSVARALIDAGLAHSPGAAGGALAEHPELASYRRSDEDLFEQFLRERCSRSIHTQQNYHGVLRRLQRFCQRQQLPSVCSLNRAHWSDWQAYLRSPPAADIMRASVAFGKDGWAPFRGPLSERSAVQSELVVRSFFAWASDPSIGAVAINPVASIRTHSARRSATRAGVDRALEDGETKYVMGALAHMPSATKEQVRKQARARWVITLAMNSGLRASEIAAARTTHILPNSKAGPGQFLLRLIRKGGVESDLPLHPSILVAWFEYRQAMRELFAAEDTRFDGRDFKADLPLVLPVRIHGQNDGQGGRQAVTTVPCATRATVWNIIKSVAKQASALAAEDKDFGCAQRLRQMSTHWLRHTFGSNLLQDGASLLEVRDLMDHASVTTTNKYLHNPGAKLARAVEHLRDRTTTAAATAADDCDDGGVD